MKIKHVMKRGGWFYFAQQELWTTSEGEYDHHELHAMAENKAVEIVRDFSIIAVHEKYRLEDQVSWLPEKEEGECLIMDFFFSI